jgi:TPP-dependent pyruvate/acetoin dehydrogenase alpha subunit
MAFITRKNPRSRFGMLYEQLLEDYQRLALIRRFETRLGELFSEGRVPGTAHFCIGQEACAVGAVRALRPEDLVTSNHRGHGHLLAKGGDPRRVLAEIMGKATGYCGGRSGSQHMSCPEIGFLGANGLTGGMIPVATGAALTQKLRATGQVVLCFFGDGATATGAFHEGLNLGAIWDLPIVYFCENNGYAMSTPLEENFRVRSVVERVAAYGLPAVQIDGNDYFAVREAAEAAVGAARTGKGPSFIEAVTWRQCGHSRGDQCEYRSRLAETEWLARDPLPRMRQGLLERGAAESELSEVERLATEQVAAALAFAEASPEPVPEVSVP